MQTATRPRHPFERNKDCFYICTSRLTVTFTLVRSLHSEMAKSQVTLELGRGIQVVTPDDDHMFVLDEDALSELLLREDVKDRAVVVISVAGAFRKGKSFLLDFFLRYLQHEYTLESGGDWLGAPDEPLKGFAWRGGSERATTGLLFWSQPFKATLHNGEKVVIFLMDTQGTFDSESTVRDNATVFALSTMLSSVQIYNISQNIEEDDLQHLQLFTDYGRLAQSTDEKVEGAIRKPFQRLQFLLRDWSYPYEYPYGADGGQLLLEKRLEVHEGQHPQLQGLRTHIRSCFQQLACFLLPHPGMKVATSPDFNGKLEDIDAEFKTSLRELVPMLLSPENLVPKLIEGQKVKARDLLHYFKAYMNIFNGSELPEPKSILAATAEANNLSAVAAARDVYDTVMEPVSAGSYMRPATLRDEHCRARDKAIHAFHSARKMGGDELAQTYCLKLTKELEDQLELQLQRNEAKNVFKFLGTPAVFISLVLLGYLLSVLGAAVGVQSVVALAQSAALAAAVMLLLWGYTRLSGNMRELGQQLDDFANILKDIVFKQALDSYGQRAAAAAVGFNADNSDKKSL